MKYILIAIFSIGLMGIIFQENIRNFNKQKKHEKSVLEQETKNGEILYEGDCFPSEIFSGIGKIEEIEVSCIEPYSQLLFHLGYDYDENDMHDVKLLCEVFHMELPEEYR